MKLMPYIIYVTIFATSASAATSDNWYSYSDDPGFTNNLMGKCTKDKSPGEYMKHFDEVEMKYVKADEKKDGGGKIISVVIIKNPGGSGQERQLYFRDKASCDKSYKSASDKEMAVNQKSKAKEDAKYGDYK
jgi:hypothetical protein